MLTSQSNTDQVTVLNLRRLFVLRNIVIGSTVLVILIAYQILDMALPLLPLIIVVIIHCVINLATLWSIRQQTPISSIELFIQLSLDTLVLAALLFFSGGSTNPFVSLFLLPSLITATILPQRYTWAMAALAVGCYTLLMFFYYPLPHAHAMHQSDFDLHVMGMWFGFLLSVGLIVFFVVRMGNSLREREHHLNLVREKALRDQHLIALGTLATGAAHALGTPLATMAVLSGELKKEHANDEDVVEKAELLRSQLDRCKHILSDITASTGQVRAEGGCRLSVNEYLDTVVEQLHTFQPAAEVNCRYHSPDPAPQILADKTLTQALINILMNAAEASIDDIQIDASWDSEYLTLAINDRGEGMPPQVKAAAGTPFYTTKTNGQGLGLYLARAVTERFGGSMELNNRDGGGMQVLIKLPLSTIGLPA